MADENDFEHTIQELLCNINYVRESYFLKKCKLRRRGYINLK